MLKNIFFLASGGGGQNSLLTHVPLYISSFILSSPGDVKNLTFTLYCGGVCVVGGGGQSRRYITIQTSTLTPLSVAVYCMFVSVGG